MRRGSLRARLALGLTLGLVAFWALGAVWALTALRRQTDALFDSALQETAQRVLPLAVMDHLSRDTDADAAADQRVSELRAHDEIITYVLREASGRVALASHDAKLSTFPADAPPGFSTTGTHRLYVEQAVRGELTLIAAEPLEHRREAARRAARALTTPLLALAPLGLLGAWLLAHWSLKPARRLAAEIETRGGGDLRPVATQALPLELTPVAAAVSRLMDRVRQTLDAERRFAANAAHELRTPIAAALAQTQRLVAATGDEALRARGREVEERLRALARLAEKLMQLARAQGARLLLDTPADVAPALRLGIEEARRASGLGARLVATLAEGPALSRLDPDALAIVARNLIENAARHGAGDGPVDVVFDGRALRVVNRGPALPADAAARLMRPFERGETQAAGAGLGLAIVAAIARESGAKLTFVSPAPGQADGVEARFEPP
jgi:two-component system OmpR family sensor kinase